MPPALPASRLLALVAKPLKWFGNKKAPQPVKSLRKLTLPTDGLGALNEYAKFDAGRPETQLLFRILSRKSRRLRHGIFPPSGLRRNLFGRDGLLGNPASPVVR